MSHVLEARELAFATCCVVQFPPPTYKAQLGNPAFPFDGKIGYLYVVIVMRERTAYQVPSGPRRSSKHLRIDVLENQSGRSRCKYPTPLTLTPTPTVTLTL